MCLLLSFSLPTFAAGSHQGTSKSHSEDDKAIGWEEYGPLNDCMEPSPLLTELDCCTVEKSIFIV